MSEKMIYVAGNVVGRCGDRLMTLKDVCALPAGHAGWHKADNGCEWTGFIGCEHACCVDAPDAAIEARVRTQVAAEERNKILTEAYWKLRQHASGLRSTKVYRKASERAEGTLHESPAYQRYRWLEATARGIEDAAQDIAEMLGIAEHEIEEAAPSGTVGNPKENDHEVS